MRILIKGQNEKIKAFVISMLLGGLKIETSMVVINRADLAPVIMKSPEIPNTNTIYNRQSSIDVPEDFDKSMGMSILIQRELSEHFINRIKQVIKTINDGQ